MAEQTQDKDKETQEALQYWGLLFQKNSSGAANCPSDKLNRLLRGIAFCISSNLDRHDSNDILPSQLAAFYHLVGGDYDPLFLDMPNQSIAFIYNSLGCLHSLQPDPSADHEGYVSPTVPALKYSGFVTWQTIQILLGPEEHVPFIQNALQEFTVVDPVDGKPFPKILPKEAFPSKPDPAMVAWHGDISDRLKKEAQHPPHRTFPPSSYHEPRRDHSPSQADRLSIETVSDEQADAATYFSNPHYRDNDGKPRIIKQITRAPGARVVMQGGKAVGTTLRNIASPHLWSGSGGNSSHASHRRHTLERASSSDHFDRHNANASKSGGQHVHFSQRRHSSSRSRSKDEDRRRRRRTPSTSSNDSRPDEELSPRSPRRGQTDPMPRRRRSFDPSAQDHQEYYFGQWDRDSHPWQGGSRPSSFGEHQPRAHFNDSASSPPATSAKMPRNHYQQSTHGTPSHPTSTSGGRHSDRLHAGQIPHRYGRSPNRRSAVYDDRNRLRPEDWTSRRGGHSSQQSSPDEPNIPIRRRGSASGESRQNQSVDSERDSLVRYDKGAAQLNGVGGRRYANELPWNRDERP